jgi:hypothetical protein
LERGVRDVNFGAIYINFELFYGNFPAEEVLDDILINVRNHRCIMIRVIPSPMLSTSIIIEKHPLKTF